MAKSFEKQTSRQKRKKREQKQRRTDIIQAAERLFITQGFKLQKRQDSAKQQFTSILVAKMIFI